MRATDYINQLRSQGRYSFSLREIEDSLGVSKIATLNALKRLRLKKMGVKPLQRFLFNRAARISNPGMLACGNVYSRPNAIPRSTLLCRLHKRRPILWRRPSKTTAISSRHFKKSIDNTLWSRLCRVYRK